LLYHQEKPPYPSTDLDVIPFPLKVKKFQKEFDELGDLLVREEDQLLQHHQLVLLLLEQYKQALKRSTPKMHPIDIQATPKLH
tara:strand:- start:20 stop:268 length:249 start_codon:yes stop_codon:yes gene_type:complete